MNILKWFKREPYLVYEKPCGGACQYAKDVGMIESNCGGIYCRSIYATKEMEALLPKASLIKIQWSSYYMDCLKTKAWKLPFFNKIRYANCLSLNYGPINIHLRAKWLIGPAQQAIEQQVGIRK